MSNMNPVLRNYSKRGWKDIIRKESPRKIMNDIMGDQRSKCHSVEFLRGITQMQKNHKEAAYAVSVFREENKSKDALDTKVIRQFLFLVCDSIVPDLFFGGITEKRKFVHFILTLPQKGFHETIFLKRFLEHSDFSSVKWMNVSDPNERCVMYKKLITWLLKDYLFGVIKYVFFVTNTVDSYKLIYYWKEQWSLKEAAAFKKFRSKCQVESIRRDVLCSQGFLCPNLQFRVKKNGLRPIMIDYYQGGCTASGEDEDTILVWAKGFLQQVLKKEDDVSPIKKGSKFLEVWKENLPFLREKKFHFVKMDISDAFGSVKHDIMEDILKALFRKYIQQNSLINIKEVKQRGRHTLRFDVFDGDISSDDGKVHTIQPELLLGVIVKSFRFQAFTWKGKTFTMRKGLIQGRLLSPILCDLYLHAMEMQFLLHLCKGSNLLVREVDDYLFISPNHEDAIRFFALLQKGIEMYDIHVKESKTQDSDACPSISFLGYRVDTVTMDIRMDWSKYCDVDPAYLLTLDCKVNDPRKFIKEKITRFCVPERLVNNEINCFETRVENLFLCSTLQAARMHRMIAHLMRREECSSLVINCGKVCASVIQRRIKEYFPKTTGRYIVFRAFEQFLRRDIRKYHGPIKYFENIIEHMEEDVPDLTIVNSVIRNVIHLFTWNK